MFKRILIANRGEIACRVMRTAHRLGVQSVAVYSEADADALHVGMANEAYCIGPAAARESYLKIETIIDVAKRSGAQAVHPGYGFLSENEEFAAACAAAGLVFIGPPVNAIRVMGSKSAAKRLMEAARVPLVPGYHGDHQDPKFLHAEADRVGYPLLIKPSAGGGGKGMRIVESSAQFPEALTGCKREAQSSFGDDKVLLERYLIRPRHIEIQVFADTHGHCIHLFERDCSVQRRHQKVLEEAPAPGMSAERRAQMGDAAVAAAKAIGYVGAGTVEFIVDAKGTFHFMEMNTRLQVEHPVTEMITEQDLVEWQLRVAAGERLPLQQSDLRINGHAIEARIYAEDPAKGFLPATGKIVHLETPLPTQHVRIDTGIRAGDRISPYYDPMIAKLIVWDVDRESALRRMDLALADFHVVGLATNINFLQRIIGCQAFASADLDTGLIERNRDALFPPSAPVSATALALATIAELGAIDEATANRADASNDRYSPWRLADGWRLNQDNHHMLAFRDGEQVREITVHYRRNGYEIESDGMRCNLSGAARGTHIDARLDQIAIQGSVVRTGHRRDIFIGGRHVVLDFVDPYDHDLEDTTGGGSLSAPMPGKVIAIMTQVGTTVLLGTPLLVMEAMKMEHTIAAPANGLVKAIHYSVGEQVAEGAMLIGFKAST
ncbi:MAG: acetyl/propionyl/methylcrotonyl-CoA carboxylase subunit alpha [Betaproteobacteria bacterium]|nr:acetyl/propionyl/methylcrotonyl-CoA carboxylase subunit alpha [Betaproteobacteria bacterium]